MSAGTHKGKYQFETDVTIKRLSWDQWPVSWRPTTVKLTTVQSSFHHRHSTNRVS